MINKNRGKGEGGKGAIGVYEYKKIKKGSAGKRRGQWERM